MKSPPPRVQARKYTGNLDEALKYLGILAEIP